MHFKWHLLSGVVGAPQFGLIFLVGAVIPDLPLIWNEIKIQKTGKSFDSNSLSKVELTMYRVSHSILLVIGLGLIKPELAGGVLLHIIIDAFTHSGKMAWQPLYPLSTFSFKRKTNQK